MNTTKRKLVLVDDGGGFKPKIVMFEWNDINRTGPVTEFHNVESRGIRDKQEFDRILRDLTSYKRNQLILDDKDVEIRELSDKVKEMNKIRSDINNLTARLSQLIMKDENKVNELVGDVE